MYDTHIHTKFSGDSDSEPPLLIHHALSMGLDGICFTDHMDLDFQIEPDLFNLNVSSYSAEVNNLKQNLPDNFFLGFGIELGLQLHLGDTYREILNNYNFDFCIASVHGMHGLDPYYDQFFDGHDIPTRYHDYFVYVLDNLKSYNDYDSLGHLDYIIRYGNDYCLRNGMAVEKLNEPELIEEILKHLINNDKCLEVNTGSFNYGFSEPNPSYGIIERYYELGGKMITLGSDAHRVDALGNKFDEVAERLKEIGFKSQFVFKNRIPSECAL